MAYRVVGPGRMVCSATEAGSVGYTEEQAPEFVVPGESLQVWGGGSLVVVDSQNRQTAIFAAGEWAYAIREVDSDA